MKKAFSILAAFVLILSVGITCFAARTLTADVTTDAITGGIAVSGTAVTDRANITLTLEIKSHLGDTVYVDSILVGYDQYNDDKTELSYSFAPAVIHPKHPSGEYTIYVSGDKVGIAKTTSYEFKGADSLLSAMKAVQDAIDKNSKAELAKALGIAEDSPEKNQLGINRELFEALETEGKDVFFDVMSDNEYDIPEDILTEEKIEKLSDAVSKIRTDYIEAVSIGQFNDIDTDADVEKWLELYGEGYDKDDNATATDEAQLYAYVTDALSEDNNLAKRISNSGKLVKAEDIKKALYENSLLTILECRHYTESKSVFEDFGGIFGIDEDLFGMLNSEQQGRVYSKACIAHDTVAKAGEYFNEVAGEILAEDEDSGLSSSSSSRGGASGFTAPSKTPEAEKSTNEAFPDVNKTMWAYDAVVTLKKAGIVSGDENGMFNPNASITRAEYIKLIVAALGISSSAGSSNFADVPENAWFKSYIDTAFEHGIITGGDNNLASPLAFITREDMAVILYRAFKLDKAEGEITFADEHAISGYAKEAVSVLAEKGIVKGVGENTFAPKATASRAQAAQIIYNILSIVR